MSSSYTRAVVTARAEAGAVAFGKQPGALTGPWTLQKALVKGQQPVKLLPATLTKETFGMKAPLNPSQRYSAPLEPRTVDDPRGQRGQTHAAFWSDCANANGRFGHHLIRSRGFRVGGRSIGTRGGAGPGCARRKTPVAAC